MGGLRWKRGKGGEEERKIRSEIELKSGKMGRWEIVGEEGRVRGNEGDNERGQEEGIEGKREGNKKGRRSRIMNEEIA